MRNEVLERLSDLMDTVGIGGEDGSVEKAETTAYAQAVSLVVEMLEQGLDEIFIDTMSEKGLAMYCGLLDIDMQTDTQALKNKMITRLASGFSPLKSSEYDAAFDDTPGLKRVYTLTGLATELSPVNKETLAAFSDFIENYYPAVFCPRFDGNGMTFDFIESLDLRWFHIDGFCIPYSILDRLQDSAETS